eukprot:scaffold2645_cov112-Isochrysis_galbana.AAC.2
MRPCEHVSSASKSNARRQPTKEKVGPRSVQPQRGTCHDPADQQGVQRGPHASDARPAPYPRPVACGPHHLETPGAKSERFVPPLRLGATRPRGSLHARRPPPRSPAHCLTRRRPCCLPRLSRPRRGTLRAPCRRAAPL